MPIFILKTAFNTVYIVKIKDKMSAISDSLKPFTPTDNSLIISITRSHSFISSVLKTVVVAITVKETTKGSMNLLSISEVYNSCRYVDMIMEVVYYLHDMINPFTCT